MNAAAISASAAGKTSGYEAVDLDCPGYPDLRPGMAHAPRYWLTFPRRLGLTLAVSLNL